VAAADDAFGPVSVLINNAAIVRFGPIAETDPDGWRQVIDINLTGTYLGIRAVVSSMRKAGGGAIVNMSAAAGMTAQFGLASYVASKWGMRGLTTRLVLFVASDEAGFSTGSEFIADGGHLLGPVPQQEHAEAAVA
jgi:3alpha(or 20beta)-hydroxysteroid dehydrogenase